MLVLIKWSARNSCVSGPSAELVAHVDESRLRSLARTGAFFRPPEILAYSYWSDKDEWRFDGPDGAVSVRTQPCMITNSGDTCRAAALAGQGVILQPSFLVYEDLAAGTLVELMPEYRGGEVGIYAVFPTRKHVAAKVRALIDFLGERFGGVGRFD